MPPENLYVADRGLAVVRKLSPAGEQNAVWGACSDGARPECQPSLFISPSGVAADGIGNVYVVDEATDRVARFSVDGKLLKMWGTEGGGPGQFEAPQAIAIKSRQPGVLGACFVGPPWRAHGAACCNHVRRVIS